MRTLRDLAAWFAALAVFIWVYAEGFQALTRYLNKRWPPEDE